MPQNTPFTAGRRTVGLTLTTALILTAGAASSALAADEAAEFGQRGPAVQSSQADFAAAGPVVLRDSRVVLGDYDLSEIQAVDAFMDREANVPYRIGVVRPLPAAIDTLTGGEWVKVANAVDGNGAATSVWVAQIEVPDAKALRVHFTALDMLDGGTVTIAGDGGLAYTYEHGGPTRTGDFWSHTVPGSVATMRYEGPAGARPNISLSEILHVYRVPQMEENGGADGLLPCHEDVNCWSPDEVARDSVGRYSFVSGGFGSVCTGALLNDADDNTFAGWFLTADHCVSTTAEVNSMEIRWFYHTVACDSGAPSLFSLPASVGCTLLEHSSLSDYSFVRTNADPGAGQGFAGWTTANPGTSIRSIHNPGGSWKRISIGNTTLQNPICGALPTSRYWYTDWNVGTTEGGSSGGPLFNSAWQVTGQLFGSCFTQEPGCNNPQFWNAVYGKFGFSYLNGGLNQYLTVVQTDDEYEDNDSFETAAPIGPGTYALQLVDFDDYFTFELPSDGTISLFSAFNGAELDLDYTLFNSDGAIVAIDWGPGSDASIDNDFPAGTYVLRCEKDGGWGGAYSLTIDLTFDPPPACPGDLDESGSIDFTDLLSVLSAWGPCPGCPQDLDGSGEVGFNDIVTLLAAWGPCE